MQKFLGSLEILWEPGSLAQLKYPTVHTTLTHIIVTHKTLTHITVTYTTLTHTTVTNTVTHIIVTHTTLTHITVIHKTLTHMTVTRDTYKTNTDIANKNYTQN